MSLIEYFQSLSSVEARAFCAALIAAQGSCVPVIDRGTELTAATVTD